MKRITAMLLMICLCLMGQSVLAEEKVGKIAVAQEPTKMDYWVGGRIFRRGRRAAGDIPRQNHC